VHVHDLHATILHLARIDHEKLTFRHSRPSIFGLTDVSGKVVHRGGGTNLRLFTNTSSAPANRLGKWLSMGIAAACALETASAAVVPEPAAKPVVAENAPAKGGANPAQIEFFEKSVRSSFGGTLRGDATAPQKARQREGWLWITRHPSARAVTRGPALVPGAPEKSLLVTAVTYKDPNLKMPPDNKRMPAEQVAILQEWVPQWRLRPARRQGLRERIPRRQKNIGRFNQFASRRFPTVRDAEVGARRHGPFRARRPSNRR
jgi:hypothetical protein